MDSNFEFHIQNNLEVNNKIFANNGTIGRRDFFLNMCYLCCFSIFFTWPANIWMQNNIGSFENIINTHKIGLSMPPLLMVFAMLSAAALIVIGISNIKRRLNDIFGYENTTIKYIICTIWITNVFWYFIPLYISFFVSIFNSVIFCCLMFAKGKITSKLPKDIKKEFNIAAFLGTGLWAIVNKVWQPLWILLLWLTPFGILFSLICGLKANEWYIKKHGEINTEAYKAKQSNQILPMFLTIYIGLPFLIFIIFIILGFGIAYNIASNPKSDFLPKLERFMNSYLNEIEKTYFTYYEIKENENIFYINDKMWQKSAFKTKTEIFELAASISAERKNKALNKNDYKNRTSKYDEMNKTKFYSTETKQLVAEFYLPDDIDTNNIKEFMKATLTAYKFYPISK